MLSQNIIAILQDGYRINELYLNDEIQYYDLKFYIDDIKEIIFKF